MSRARTGKIARLPKEIRDVINLMLRDGATGSEVIMIGRKHGCALNEQNVSNWREGGYQDWLKEQERLADMQAKREFALEIVRTNEGSKIHEASLQLAASQLYEALTDFDPAGLKDLLANKPENYADVVNALARLSKGSLEIEKFKDHVAERKRAIERELGAAKKSGGLTKETIAKIEEELGLL